MADTAARADAEPAVEPEDEDMPEVVWVTPEEGRRMFDEAVRHFMGISGEEFLRRYDAGEYNEIADKAGYRHIMYLEGLLGLVR